MNNQEEVQFLFQKYLDGNATPQEVETWVAYFKAEDNSQALKVLIQQYMEQEELPGQSVQHQIENVVSKSDKAMHSFIQQVKGLSLKRRTWLYAAASMLILVSAGLF